MIKASNNLTGKLNASIIHVYPELENIEITPAVEDQEFKSDMYGYDKVRVKGVQSYIDEDIKPEYIKDGIDILGVVGNVVELKGEEKVITPKTTLQTILPSEDKNGITKITVQPVDRTIDEDIKPENIIDGVEILGVVGNYKGIDTSDATVTPDKVLAGTTVYINNEKIEGTLPNNGELEFTPSDELQIVPEGYTSGGIVSATDITKLNEYDKCLMIANSIEDMSDYSDTTATPEDIVEGKTAYSNGERITGTMKANDNTAILDGTLYVAGTTNIPLMIKSISKIVFPKENAGSIFNGCSNLEYIGEIDSSATNYMDSIFEKCAKLKELPFFDTSNCSTMRTCCSGCSSLISIPILNTTKLTGMGLYYSFYNCSSLSDESLNNIMKMCINATGIGASYKTLKQVGLSSTQATRCQSLSNYEAFTSAGWTTGY